MIGPVVVENLLEKVLEKIYIRETKDFVENCECVIDEKVTSIQL